MVELLGCHHEGDVERLVPGLDVEDKSGRIGEVFTEVGVQVRILPEIGQRLVGPLILRRRVRHGTSVGDLPGGQDDAVRERGDRLCHEVREDPDLDAARLRDLRPARMPRDARADQHLGEEIVILALRRRVGRREHLCAQGRNARQRKRCGEKLCVTTFHLHLPFPCLRSQCPTRATR